MNTIVQISRDDERLEAATRWVLKIDEGALNASDKAALSTWLDADNKHRDVLLEVAAVWDKTDTLRQLAYLFPHETVSKQPSSAFWSRPWIQGISFAASLIVLAVVGLQLVPHQDPGFENVQPLLVQTAVYETAIGEQKTVFLPDGSQVVLNTNSQLSQTFTPSARVLYLEQGEILLRVAKDSSRPFSVVAGGRIIQAVGTEFMVEITQNHYIEVMVSEGKVLVGIQPMPVGLRNSAKSHSDGAQAPIVLPPLLTELENITVSAGEIVTLDAVSTVKKTVSAEDMEVKLSWKEGHLIFRSDPLEKVLQEVERYTAVEFILLDEDLKSLSVSGRFRTSDVEALLESLRLNFGITYKFNGENYVLLSNP